jgi:hypothetical protein
VRAGVIVVGDWKIFLALQLLGFGVLLTVCVVVVVTAASHTIEVGLMAGSYAGGLLGVLLTGATLLSMIF